MVVVVSKSLAPTPGSRHEFGKGFVERVEEPRDPHETEYKAATFIETYTGRPFWPLDPKPENISIIDIAHNLSNQGRYSGSTQTFYCPAMTERVLTSDLRWVPAGDLQIGEMLVGFDEYPFNIGSCGNKRRRYRPSAITNFVPVKRRMIRLEFSDGSTVRAAADHPWLAMTGTESRNQTWLTASEIKNAVDAEQGRWLHKFIAPWATNFDIEAGWLAGMLDGEGSVRLKSPGLSVQVSQNEGPVLARLQDAIKKYGYIYTLDDAKKCRVIRILGGWRENSRFLGSLRPTRLLANFEAALLGGEFSAQLEGEKRAAPLKVVKCFVEDEEWCAGIETSSRTYLCEGFGAHNSTAQHCCLLADFVERVVKGSTPLDCLQILIHDSAEAYLVDIPRPVKQYMPEYRKWDKKITMVIRSWLGLGDVPIPDWQDELDSRIIVDERAQLMSDSGLDWGHHDLEALDIYIEPWTPRVAEQQFLMRYASYTKKVFGKHHYLRSGWGVPTNATFKEFPFRTGGSDIAQRGEVEPKLITDLIEVDLLGGVGRVALRSPDGMMVRDTKAGTFPRPAWRWLHGRFELASSGVEDIVVTTDEAVR